ncbi:S1 family peptidase [Streptomyces coeruleorubidus]|uniref:S1 family peptidase n=1 Tax=Streptomyces coeruleorubidus TaxID=116188 RepID=UPI0036F7332F
MTAAVAVVAATSAQAIVGGKPAKIDKNSFLVALRFEGKHFRTGTLISPTKVLTGAQCLMADGRGPDTTRVIVGRTNVWNEGGTENKVEGVSPPQDPDGYTDYGISGGKVNVPNNDIAVLLLKTPMPSAYKPIKWVSAGFAYKPDTHARIIGWGTTSEDQEETPGDLRQAKIRIQPGAACTAAYQGDYNPGNMTCAGRPEGGVDACTHDSGGPLLVSDGKEERVAGIVSWGEGCAEAGKPGVYTKVSKFADWLATLQ